MAQVELHCSMNVLPTDLVDFAPVTISEDCKFQVQFKFQEKYDLARFDDENPDCKFIALIIAFILLLTQSADINSAISLDIKKKTLQLRASTDRKKKIVSNNKALKNTSEPSLITLENLFENLVSTSTVLQKKKRNVDSLIDSTKRGLEKKYVPKIIPEGEGGSYFMYDQNGDYVAVFKPNDEEPTLSGNPKNSPDQESQLDNDCPIPEGRGYVREAAAYLLDHEGFSGVPPTALVEMNLPAFADGTKLGSLQKFVPHDSDCSDIGTRSFPIDEVHKIAVLDCRMMNADRHAGNILYQKQTDDTVKLIPIDHGYCLPKSLGKSWFEWQYWPQSKEKLSESTLEYIERIDIERDIKVLQDLGISTSSQNTLKISTMLLKKCAKVGLTFSDIASFMCSQIGETSSLEKMVQKCLNSTEVDLSSCSPNFYNNLSQVMDSEISAFSPKY